jgi:hypothetical protein
VCVTPWTVDEYRQSLERGRHELHRYPVTPSEYADLLAEATSDEDFVTAYWRQAKDSPVTVDDYFAHWIEVESHLEALGIEIRSEGCIAVDQRTEEITDEIGVLAKVLHGRYRHPVLLEHDVKHRMLVERLRGAGNRTFANAGYWFLTFDTMLPRYDYHARRESRATLPFCVSAGSWFQIIAAFRPKTDDEGRTLADLLASPYVRYRRTLSKDKAQKVVARVQFHSGGDPQLAARVMMNSILVKEIEDSAPEEETETIDNAIVAAAKQAQEAARRAQEAAAIERERAELLEQQTREELQAARARAATEQADAEARHEQALQAERARAEARAREEQDRGQTRLCEAEEKHRREVRELAGRLQQIEASARRIRRASAHSLRALPSL